MNVDFRVVFKQKLAPLTDFVEPFSNNTIKNSLFIKKEKPSHPPLSSFIDQSVKGR
jgi:hypothetical protein